MSDESDDEVMENESHEEMNYRRKYQMLLERCEVLQQDNERIINRIQHVYKYTRQIRKERLFLIKRLEGHNDNWHHNINQYLLDSLAKTSKPKTILPSTPTEKSSRRSSSSSTKKPRHKDKDSKRSSKDSKVWMEKVIVESELSQKIH